MPLNLEINDPRNRGWKNLLGLRVSISGSDIWDMLETIDVMSADYVMKDLEEIFQKIEEVFSIEERDGHLCFVARTQSCESFISGDLWHIIREAILPEPGCPFEDKEQLELSRIKLERLEWLVTCLREEFDKKIATQDFEK